MDAPTELELRAAYQRLRIKQPYEVAMQNHALALCIKNSAVARQRRMVAASKQVDPKRLAANDN